ncbi:MAG: YbaB/EbfC family nucleoid-associated protein [Planctomycetota bacterium]
MTEPTDKDKDEKDKPETEPASESKPDAPTSEPADSSASEPGDAASTGADSDEPSTGKTGSNDPMSMLGDMLGKVMKDMPGLFGGEKKDGADSDAARGLNPSDMLKAAGGVMKTMKDKAQKKIEERRRAQFSATVGGGMVKATVDGNFNLLEIKFSRDIIDPNDIQMISDLTVSAVNAAIKKARQQFPDTALPGGLDISSLIPGLG